MANTDSAGGGFTVTGNFYTDDGTSISQVKTLTLLSGQQSAVVFDEIKNKSMTRYGYEVSPPSKTVSEIVHSKVPLTFESQRTERFE